MPLYRQLNKQRNSMLHKDKKHFIEGKATELKQAAQKKDIGATFKILRELTGQHTTASTSLKVVNGETIYDLSKCLGAKRKSSKTDCNNYRGITVLPVLGKLFPMLLLKRATSFLHTLHRPKQAGFMPGRSTTEQIHTVTQIVKKTVEFNKKA